ncbi:MAG: 3-hydroxyacyl-ACP dehydratase FabZ [Planctomycetes bacterium]|nr:3-hydroxyacyl-ACP dehydratase FabZ [Planctomycetota bacterium]
MPRRQRTIKKATELEGVALHSGESVQVRIEPASPGTGVVFVRSDLDDPADIPALAGNLTVSMRRTVLRAGNNMVGMVEHLLAACLGLQVDNLRVYVSGDEMPGMDGSSLPYVEALRSGGIVEQKEDRKEYVVEQPEVFRDEFGNEIILLPPTGEGLKIRYFPEYPKGVDASPFFLDLTSDDFSAEIAPTRTFVRASEIDDLLEAGLGKGANAENTLVLGGNEAPAMRLEREPTRHKVLDVLGDLALVGADLRADLICNRSGHNLNQVVARHLREELDAEEIRGEGYGIQYDIQQVLRRLPHRYPLLLVDRVIEVEGFRRAVGLKNVTINEPFFQGHFPGQPIMPGVLQLEALAQLTGFLLQRKLEMTGMLGVLASIDKVRFRGTVVPGDQLRLEVEILRLQRNRAQVKAQAKVGRRIASEAMLSFAMIEPASP